MKSYKNKQNAAILKKSRDQKIATADLQQITHSFSEVIRFMEEFDTMLHPLFKDLEDLSPMVCSE